MVTREVRDLARRILSIEDISTAELRLMPYVQHVMMNEQRIKPALINAEDRGILQEWRDRGWIEGGVSGLAVTREFWDAMHEILWVAYVVQQCEWRGDG